MNAQFKENTAPFIGQALYSTLYDDKTGYIFAIDKTDGNCFVIGAGGMQSAGAELSIVWDNGTTSPRLPQGVAQKWIDTAARMEIEPATPAKIYEMIQAAADRSKKQDEQRQAAAKSTNDARQAFNEKHRADIPAGAVAYIVATRIINDSDLMSDYHGHKTGESIILGFSTHKRNLFPELRKVCAGVPEVEHFAIKPVKPADANEWWTAADEHRENYSMGHGTYLKIGGRDCDGWEVAKHTFYGDGDKIDHLPVARWEVKTAAAKPARAARPSTGGGLAGAGYAIEDGKKDGYSQIRFDDKPAAETRYKLKAAGFRWSRFNGVWYGKAENLPDLGGNEPTPQTTGGTRPPVDKSDKLRTLADKMQSTIDNKLGDRQTNTPKRMAEAANARLDGERLKRTQTVLYGLADLHEAGQVPDVLQNITSKKAVYDLMSEKTTQTGTGFYYYSIGTGERRDDTLAAVVLWSMLTPKSDEEKAADELAGKVRDLQFSNIAGYFPTPAPVRAQVIEAACIQDYHRVLEPSAGDGAFCDDLAAILSEDGALQCFEINHTLRGILEAKGYDVGGDFMECFEPPMLFDRIVMNPPFEKLQDVEHIQRAHSFLKDGGRLVAIMSPSAFFRDDKKSRAFREWFDLLGGERVDLPAGSFKESGTGVNSVMVIIDNDLPEMLKPQSN